MDSNLIVRRGNDAVGPRSPNALRQARAASPQEGSFRPPPASQLVQLEQSPQVFR
jgi:hypothetical protein